MKEQKQTPAVQNGSKAHHTDPQTHQQSLRDIDPNVLQRRASNPDSSVWVSASAGSGKTKVLTDRVLRLLLPRSKSEPGTPIHKILCLTFTKAAASEMALRISSILSDWAILPETAEDQKPSLHSTLSALLGRPPQSYEIQAARRLFASVVDRPNGGLQIMTIHAFCQSLLGRFPLESDVSPAFEVMEERDAKAMLSQARRLAFHDAAPDSPINKALRHLASHLSEPQLDSLLGDIAKEREQFTRILNHYNGLDALINALCKTYKIDTIKPEYALDEIAADLGPAENDLRRAAQTLAENDASGDQKRAAQILEFLALPPSQRPQGYARYKYAFLTAKDEPAKKLCTNAVAKSHPDIVDILTHEQERILNAEDTKKKHICAGLTRDLFQIAQNTIENYSALKKQQNLLDFDDLIEKTSRLLNQDINTAQIAMRSWVLYKLDQGIDHILVDEAQDTNPEQWQILSALCEEFYAGFGARDEIQRSLFVVGDEKQSIYSFQRASPEEFKSMRQYFQRRIEQAEQNWDPVNLNISFRTTKSVLGLVDAVFTHPDMPADPGFDAVQHVPFRRGQAGLAELWPIFENEEDTPSQPWEPPTEIEDTRTGAQKCALYIAETIERWLKTKEPLESQDRPINAGDIMILVRSRNAFVSQLIRALKQKNIPVSGQDRMVLGKQLVIQDLCALAEFALYPNNDLNLAALLKSPFIGMSEEDLYALCVERSKAPLWEVLQNAPAHKDLAAYLDTIRRNAGTTRPYEFFAHALHMPCPHDDISAIRAIHGRMGDDTTDPIEEFLSLTLDYEAKHTPSLQNFLQSFQSDTIEVKRQLEDVRGAVRIMTVHGSKGLQAPIVILPDTIRAKRHIPSQVEKRLLWPQKTGLDIPLFSPRAETDFDLYKERFDALEDRNDEEYRRLLYVAMTRAEDRLYIAGYQSKAKPIPQSWYNYCANAFEAMEEAEQHEEPGLEAYGDKTLLYRLYNPQMTEAKSKSSAEDEGAGASITPLPAWVFSPAPIEPTPPRPLIPSRPSTPEQSVLSPLDNKDNRFLRGNLTHKLLQILPELPSQQRQDAASNYLKHYAAEFSEAIRREIISETLAILNHSDFADLFGPNSLAEVPLTGLIGAEVISGQIDRLLVSDTHVKIVDYKTNRPPPQHVKDVPEIYWTQMRAYYGALRQIYPDHTISCALLWTDGPRLMPLDITD